VVAALEVALLDEPEDQLVIAADELDQTLIGQAGVGHSASSLRTGAL
jgi:hypothetical protein